MHKTLKLGKIKLYQKLAIVIISLANMTCSVSDTDLENGWWKYGSGQSIGDVLDFKKLRILEDTIFRKQQPIGVILEREASLLGLTSKKLFVLPLIETSNSMEDYFNEMKVAFPDSYETYENLYSNEIGIYHQK